MKLTRYKATTIFMLSSLLILIAVSLSVILTVSYFFKKEVIIQAQEKSDIILDRNLSVHEYFSRQLKPDLFEILQDTLESGNYFEPSWMSSTHALLYIQRYFSERNDFGYYYKDAAINARSPENEADSMERDFLETLRENPNAEAREGITEIGGKKYYYFMKKGERMTKTCLRCHNTPEEAPKKMVQIYGKEKSFNRKQDEIISVASVRIPLDKAYAGAEKNILIIGGLLSVIILIIILIYVYMQKRIIFNPINLLRKQAIAISKDNDLLGETIKVNTSKDLTELIDAFNLMSQRLYEYHRSLEDKVKEKTLSLEKKVEEVSRLNDEKNKFISILAHDLKSPFNTLLGFSSILAKNAHKFDAEKIMMQSNIINETAKRTYNLLEEILLWGRANSGQIPVEPTVLNIARVCREVVEIIQADARNKNIEIHCDNLDMMSVTADENILKTVLRNLISNAVKFSYPGGGITVSAEENQSEIIISVSDTGVGISDDALEHLFDSAHIQTTPGTAH